MKELNSNHHVYVLASPTRPRLVKVGRSNNSSRVPALMKMGYGGVTDWELARAIPVASYQAAVAIESMIHARLSNEGHRIPRFPWTNLVNARPSFADECFSCAADHALSVAEHMTAVYDQSVA